MDALGAGPCATADVSFGPAVPLTCRGGFDFTLLFEQVFFSIVPAAVLLVAGVIRLWQLLGRGSRSHSHHSAPIAPASRSGPTSPSPSLSASGPSRATAFPLLPIGKHVAAFAYAASHLASLVLWTLPGTFRTDVSVLSAALNLGAALMLWDLSHWEAKLATRPSPVLNVYLLSTLLLDAVQVRTLWLAALEPDAGYADGLRRVAVAAAVAIGVKGVMLVLEALPKNQPGFQHDEETSSREDTAGVYSLRTFWWLNRILWSGFRGRKLQAGDLYAIDAGLKTERYSEPLAAAWARADKAGKHGLLWSVLCTLKWPLLVPALPRLVMIGFNFAQPLLLRRLLEHISHRPPSSSSSSSDTTSSATAQLDKNTGYALIGATFLVYLGLALSNGYYGYLLARSITLVRGALIDAIFRQSLQIDLSSSPNGSAAVAAPTGLVTADVERIDFTVEKLHALWASTAELGLGLWLIAREVGWASIAPGAVAIACTAATAGLSRLLPLRQKKWNQAVQARVGLTARLLHNMKTVKLLGPVFGGYVGQVLQDARVDELMASAGFRKCMAVVNTLVLVPRQMAAPWTLALYVLGVQQTNGGLLDASRAFTTLALVEVVVVPLALLLQTLPSVTTTLACVDRIQGYLLEPRRGEYRDREVHTRTGSVAVGNNDEGWNEKPGMSKPSPRFPDIMVARFQEASFAYDNNEIVLGPVTFSIPRGTTTAIVGPVGSGKSTLLKALLGEVGLAGGQVHVSPGRIAYCDQTPWIPNGSVRECIVGLCDADRPNRFLTVDPAWFDEVVRTCALDDDMNQWAAGAETGVGSRGVALSEGQKHRVALARALYARAPVLVLDDVFRALDGRTKRVVCERLLGPDGWARRHGVTVVCATSATLHVLPLARRVIVLDERGRLVPEGDRDGLRGEGGELQEEQEALSDTPEEVQTEMITRKTRKGGAPRSKGSARMTTEKVGESNRRSAQQTTKATAPSNNYAFFFRPVGIPRLAVFVITILSLAFLTRFQRIWLQWWTEAPSRAHYPLFIGIYFLLATLACLSFTLMFWWLFLFVTPRTAAALHWQLLHTILHAPLAYFSATDAGAILNRFGQDMAILNGALPINFFQAASSGMLILGQLALMAYSSTYMSLALPATLGALWLLARFYLCTSRQLRVLEIELKAPVYTLLSETLDPPGLRTIRALGWQPAYRARLHARVDTSKRAVYMLLLAQRWMGFVLDCVVAALAALMVALATQLRRGATNAAAAQLGVGLTSVIGFSVLVAQFVVTYTELENSLGAVARVRECVETTASEEISAGADGDAGQDEPPKDWPSEGAVEFCHVTAGYGDGAGVDSDDHDTLEPKAVVRDVSFRAGAGQWVWICGRTGSGKSTLLAILCRLIDVHQGGPGWVLVDGRDIASLRPSTVRQRIAVVPQAPFFVPGSVRLNLSLFLSPGPSSSVRENRRYDPVDAAADADMVAALTDVGLWDHVSSHGGLDGSLDALALSHGQQQLFGLAGALLKVRRQRTKIVVMDEATSGVDADTERRMNQLVRQAFGGCTVLAVTHRLEAIAQEDWVVVMEGGRCVGSGLRRELERRGVRVG